MMCPVEFATRAIWFTRVPTLAMERCDACRSSLKPIRSACVNAWSSRRGPNSTSRAYRLIIPESLAAYPLSRPHCLARSMRRRFSSVLNRMRKNSVRDSEPRCGMVVETSSSSSIGNLFHRPRLSRVFIGQRSDPSTVRWRGRTTMWFSIARARATSQFVDTNC